MDSSSSSSLLGICAATVGCFTILVNLLFTVYRKFRSNPQNQTAASSSSSPNWKLQVSSSSNPNDSEGKSNELLLHAVYIYCSNTLQYSFASHLSVDFRRKRIAAYVNCNRNLDVIQGASASVVVFSKDCLSSTSYLDKLVTVLHCRRKTGQLVVPVFYGVNPSELAVPEHDSADRTREWSSALHQLRELPSHQTREECNECQVVEEIVKDVYEKLFPTEQIGINSRLLEIEHLLCKQPWGIRRIGIWGMPGIGKTTLAKAVFDQISGGYEASCFIKHFDKAFHEKGPHRLLEEHFGRTLKELPRVCSSITRPSLPGDELSKKRTLVVLDDVLNPLVAETFLGGLHWFAPGTLIIITSRDKQVFRHCQINHVYEVRSFNENEALQLLSQCAFGNDIRGLKRLQLSMEVIDYASGNPLALSFYGRELKGKKLSAMETTFLKLKLRTPYKIHDLLNSSHKTLNDHEKNIFLDIACFFIGEDVDYVMPLLDGCGFFPHVGIDVLVDKCLVTISESRVKMHRMIQDFGREIINGETVQIERRRRLWEPWTIKFLLEDDKLEANGYPKATCERALGTEDIEGIFLDTSNLLFDVKPTAFDNMLNLRFLKIYCSNHEKQYGLRLPRGLESLPYELRLLHWENYPLESLPQDFDPCHLVELNMPYSQLQKLWGGSKSLDMLKTCKLCHSQQLTEIDDLCKAQNIELIDLQGCTKLQRFPATGQQQHLRVVNLSGCTEIRSFPDFSPNIEELHLQGTSIRELPISIVSLSKQAKLNRELSNLLTGFSDVSNALNDSLVRVVSSNQHLGKLVLLNMKDCSHLQSLPQMADLESLQVLDLSGCSELKGIQGLPRNLKELYLAGTAIEELPQLPWSIELLNAHGCASLISIPFDVERLPRYYTFSNCFALSEQVVSEFVKNALANVERNAREYQQELSKSLAFSFTVPSPASKNFTFDLQQGSSVMIQLGSSWRSTLGFSIFVEVSFSEDYHEASGFGISCVCRWKDKECVSHSLEKSFHRWTPREGVLEEHTFVFCDLNMHPSTCGGNDPSIFADLVVFEFFTVNKEKKIKDESCTVTKCGVHVINAESGDASSNMTRQFSSSDDVQEFFYYGVEQVLRVIYDELDETNRNLFLYITSLFNDEETDFLAPLIASSGVGVSSGLEVLANKSLIHISPCGIVVPHRLLQKLGRVRREIVHRQSIAMASSSSSLSSISKYDVFTSFCEEDDCNDKISHLLAELECEKIGTFKGKMKRSKSVGPELVKEIRESRCLIVVLSKNYASSSRCLDELVEIMNSKEDLAQKVVPIFYNVVPCDVGKQSGDFGRVFENTCIGKSEDEKQKWVQALADIAIIKGVDAQWDYEPNMIKNLPQSIHGTECSSSTATTAATTNSSVGRGSQFSKAVSESSGGIMSDSRQILESPNLKVYTFLELKTVTRNFRPDMMLGEGGFGEVYKGWIDAKTLAPSKAGSGMCVAIKRLNSRSVQGIAGWHTSLVKFLGMLSHPNLVKLLGYCHEDKEFLLVYEFMPKGSLENHLFHRGNKPFPWDLRIKIVIGAARGLAFLHGLERQVIYGDFKASNILLDSSYDAKISDFGLVKFPYGYVAPGYIATGHLSVKSDVYAFGVVLLEVMTGEKAHDPKRPIGQKNLVDWLRAELKSKHKGKHIMDKEIKGQYSSKVAEEIGRITFSCIEPDPRNRPHMKEVLDLLEHILSIKVVSDPAPAKKLLGRLGNVLSF